MSQYYVQERHKGRNHGKAKVRKGTLEEVIAQLEKTYGVGTIDTRKVQGIDVTHFNPCFCSVPCEFYVSSKEEVDAIIKSEGVSGDTLKE